MWRWARLVLLLLAPLWPVPAALAEPALGELASGGSGQVREVIDGDTVRLADGREVRLVGLQAPKLPLGRPNVPAWPLAEDARAALERLCLGREANLRYGGARQDRHGRQLAHLVLADGIWVQGWMLRQGLARVYTFADNRALAAPMLALERQARAARRGIWAHAYYRILPPEDAARKIGSFQLVQGTVRRAERVRELIYLNFGEDWRSDFTVSIRRRDAAAFMAAGLDPAALEGRQVRIRGWLDSRNGPMIEASHPEQLELPAPDD